GQDWPYQRAFTTIRAVCVPAGEHVVEWTYRPTIFIAGGALSAVSLLLVLWSATAIWRAQDKRRQSDASLTKPQR
ncbi:MAG: hypothetical protein PVG33_06385, partial [Chloroflexota bacterium]